jgi:hypothetical protein
MARVRDVLVRRATEAFVLLETVEQDRPLVVHVHGIPGIGKSSLLEACAQRPLAACVAWGTALCSRSTTTRFSG